MWVDDATVEPTDVTDLHGKPTGTRAHAVRPYIVGEILPEGSGIREDPSLDVSWNRQGNVQVSIEAPTDWWERFEQARVGEKSDRTHYAAFTSTLSRQDINDMIRVLRRARDAAYGADE